jgi:two-component system LytT family response regulator
MIKTLIVEDEEPAAIRLKKLLNEVADDIEIVNWVDSIEGAVKWLKANPAPDLLMLDIQLGDGLSFEIFRQVQIESFVIFTTAYDEYAIKAFELNSIDYLLKPIDKEKLERSIAKFRKLKSPTSQLTINELIQTIESKTGNYKKRFLINMGAKIKSIETKDIASFYVMEKSCLLSTLEGRSYPIDFSLDKLEGLLNPDLFFRINRQAMVNFHAIDKISVFSKSRIKLELNPKNEIEMLVMTPRPASWRSR